MKGWQRRIRWRLDYGPEKRKEEGEEGEGGEEKIEDGREGEGEEELKFFCNSFLLYFVSMLILNLPLSK